MALTSGTTAVVAGIDVGNSTTEVVLGRPIGNDGGEGRAGIELVAAGRTPTRGAKGSPASLDAAGELVRRLERRHGVQVGSAAAAPLRPVETATATLPEDRAGTGRLTVLAAGSATAGGSGAGAGRPLLLGDGPAEARGDGPVVAVVPAGTGYRAAVAGLAPLAESGRLAAVVLGDDEAVLVAHRLPVDVPVVDQVADLDAVLRADLLAVEVSAGGRPLRSVTDPLRLSSLLGLAESELPDAAALAARLVDASNAVVALAATPVAPAIGAAGWVEVGEGGERAPLPAGLERLRSGPVGLARRYALPPGFTTYDVDDLWAVDLATVAAQVQARQGGPRPLALASLRADAPYADPAGGLGERLGVPVRVARSEAAAARRGALSTPGTPRDAVVVDLGGGTLDTVSPARAVVAAGGGELLTLAVAALAGITAAAAEHVKRGPAHRVESPQLLLAEDGSRAFLDRPAPREAVGALVVQGPAGLLPFHRALAPGEWRALRRRLKVDLLGANIARALRTLDADPRSVVVVGGPAGDEEVLAAVTGALPGGAAVGRGEVGGSLGHRYAVAYGLLALAAHDDLS